jgi:hypothetical protein
MMTRRIVTRINLNPFIKSRFAQCVEREFSVNALRLTNVPAFSQIEMNQTRTCFAPDFQFFAVNFTPTEVV